MVDQESTELNRWAAAVPAHIDDPTECSGALKTLKGRAQSRRFRRVEHESVHAQVAERAGQQLRERHGDKVRPQLQIDRFCAWRPYGEYVGSFRLPIQAR